VQLRPARIALHLPAKPSVSLKPETGGRERDPAVNGAICEADKTVLEVVINAKIPDFIVI
jgi:hypothetical protein